MADEQPGAGENALELLLVDRLVDKDLAADLPACEIDESASVAANSVGHRLYGPPARTARARVNTPIKAAPPRRSTRAHSSTVAPVVSTSSTMTTRLPRTVRRCAQGEGAAHVARPRQWPKTTLRRGAAAAHQPVRRDRRPAGGMDRVRQYRRLVVTAREQPGPMQWHRHQKVGAVEHLAAGASHPAAERLRQMGAVAVFQRQHQAAAVLVIAQNGARPLPAGSLASAVCAHCAVAHRMRKRQAAYRAPRRREKADRRPAAAAQRIRLVHRGAAGEAARRQYPVDDGAPGLPGELAKPRGQGCR